VIVGLFVDVCCILHCFFPIIKAETTDIFGWRLKFCWKHHRLSDHQILWFLPYVVRQVRICYIHVYLLLVVVTSLLGIDWPVLTCVLQESSGLSDVPFQNGHELKVYPILAGGSEHFLFICIYKYIGNSNPNWPIFFRGLKPPTR
jgi:hypothetical protein